MRLPVAMDQCADVVILGEKYPPVLSGFGQESHIA